MFAQRCLFDPRSTMPIGDSDTTHFTTKTVHLA